MRCINRQLNEVTLQLGCFILYLNNTHVMTALHLCLAARKSVEEIQSFAMESSALADDVKGWIVRQVHACLQHRAPREMYNTQLRIQLAIGGVHSHQGFKDALPKSYKKVMAFLAAEFGSLTYIYDRFADCPFVFRCEFQDCDRCPRCTARRYHIHGTHRNVRARLLICPLSEWIKYLYRHPEFARSAMYCTFCSVSPMLSG